MKQLKLIIPLIFFAFISQAQSLYPSTYQQLGSAATAVEDKGGLFIRETFLPPKFTDTTSANLTRSKLYAGSVIITNDTIVWVRNAAKTKWALIGSSGGGSSSLTATYIPVGNGIGNPFVGSANLTYASNSLNLLGRLNSSYTGGVGTLFISQDADGTIGEFGGKLNSTDSAMLRVSSEDPEAGLFSYSTANDFQGRVFTNANNAAMEAFDGSHNQLSSIYAAPDGVILQAFGSSIIRMEGLIKATNYGLGGVTGTPTYNLSVDASGNVIETNYLSPADTTFQWSVLSTLNTPSGSAVSGDVYLVGTNPTGGGNPFVGHANEIATYNGATYTFQTASAGDLLYDANTYLVSKFNGSTWSVIGKPPHIQGGDRFGATAIIGTADNQAVGFRTNGTNRLNISKTGQFTFVPLTGAAAGLAGFSTTGVLSNVQPSSDITVSSSAIGLSTVNSNVGTFTNATLTVDAKGRISAASSGSAPEVPLTFSTGLTRSSNTITSNISTGVSGGQTIYGGTAATDGLTIQSTNTGATSTSTGITFKGGSSTTLGTFKNSGTQSWTLGTMVAGTPLIAYTGAFPASISATNTAIDYQISSPGGTNSNTIRGFNVDITNSGGTLSGAIVGIRAGILAPTSGSDIYAGTGARAFTASASGSSTGLNMGGYFNSTNATGTNAGIVAIGAAVNTNAVGIGALIIGSKSLSGGAQIGAYIGNNTSSPTLNETAGLIVDGFGASGEAIQIWKQSGITVATLNISGTTPTARMFIGGTTTPTATLHLAASGGQASTAPIKLTAGIVLSTPEDGAIEYASSHIYFTVGSTRYQLDQQGSGGGGGTVTSVAQSFTGGLISVSGSPITTNGTLALTVAGTSGGIPYFSSSSTWASSGALAANALVIGGGAGAAPSTTTTGTGVLTALGVNTGSAGAFVVNGGALGTPSSGVATNLTGTASGLTAGNVTTNANLTGVITSVGNATSIASQTGTGTKFVVDNTPTLITPVLGVASATSLSVTGASGAGFVKLLGQASVPTSPAAGTLLLYSETTQGFTRLVQDDESTTNLTLGRDNAIITKNTSGATIAKGSVVYITGSTGNVPNISKAQANSNSTLPALGVVVDDIANNAFGQVMTMGILSSYNTSSFTSGDILYVSTSSAGGLTNVRPSGTTNLVQKVGTVLVSGVGNGSIEVATTPIILNRETGTTAATWTGSAIVGTSVTATTFTGALTGNASTATNVAVGGITGLGTGVATALAVNVGSAGAFVTFNGAGGTPSSLTLTNATGLPTAGLVNNAVTTAKLQQGAAYTFLANNTNATANYADNTFKANARQTYAGTITWTGTTAPSGTLNQTYSWTQIGNMVTLTISINYSVAGAANTALTLTLPSDCPSPSNPTGLGAANTKVFTGFGYIDQSLTGNPPATRVTLAENSGATGWVLSGAAGSQAAITAQFTVIYFTN